MKRLIYISLLCISQTLAGMDSTSSRRCRNTDHTIAPKEQRRMDALWIDEEDRVSISSFTNAVHQRYYFIARLEPAHTLIESLNCSCIVTYQDYQALSHIQPQHPRIINCIEGMQQDQTCAPLLELWHEVSSYKYLTDEQFFKEYTTLVCIVAHQLVTLLHEQLSPEEKKTLATVFNRAQASASSIGSYAVAYRYYIIKRLKKARTLFKRCAETPCDYAIYTYLPTCTDTRIVRCAQAIETTGSLVPLIELLGDLEQFQSIDEIPFIHELLELILVIEQHALAPMYLPRQRELCAHYEHDIEGLSVEELLKSIDILTAHIEPYAFTEQQTGIMPSVGSVATVLCTGVITWYALNTLKVLR